MNFAEEGLGRVGCCCLGVGHLFLLRVGGTLGPGTPGFAGSRHLGVEAGWSGPLKKESTPNGQKPLDR